MKKAKYQVLAQRFIESIEAGKLKDGEKMLSLRKFAKQHGISVSTAVCCYQELESLGWLVSRPQSGFFIVDRSTMVPTPTWHTFASQIAPPAQLPLRPDIPCGPLGTASLALSDTTQRQLTSSFRRVLPKTATLARYPELQGERTLLDALAMHFSSIGFPLQANELVVTNGCLEAVRTALEVCTIPGDVVAVSSPCFNGLLELLSQMSLKILEIPSVTDGIDLDQLEQYMSRGQIQAGLFCTTHMNPQGLTMSVEQKQRLAMLANKYCIPVIEDDVYFELSHSESQPLPATYYDQAGYLLWCGSISKSISPSYRVGWCRPGRFFQAFLRRALGVSVLEQQMLADFIDKGHYAKHLKQTRHQLKLQKAQYVNYLANALPKGTKVSDPDGGLVLWLVIPDFSAAEFSIMAEKAQLDVRVGSWFSSSTRYDDCLRINIGNPITQEIQSALDLLTQLVQKVVESTLRKEG